MAVIASEARQSSALIKAGFSGLPRRCTPRNDPLTSIFLKVRTAHPTVSPALTDFSSFQPSTSLK
jgi:hypothetical protein